ncbi:flagellar hook assembly protein FlgD [Cellulomonas edaphi]|uniref:Flagellar hook capping FlgD N-terminal domain-containing protein n=1 Tax=Cellulomonas edaphi TaxID=3053468 RepID=A0ABT7S4K8_9CELL|nr:flagellar hook capping FlgD N-terminal domain-containing protein [Cellulomons edaphi]MDM7830550.1 flagellar hook capping FlgD N-terminal domain-containing protein [Cellulomons edaphi]
MSIDTSYATSPTGAAAGASTPASAPSGDLDKQAFLNLLVTQLRNQDPSSPMDSSQLMAQTTQLTTMEKLVELSDTSRESFALQMRVAASSFVGKQVSWTDADGVDHSGVAAGVSFAGPVPTVSIDGKDVPLDQVSAVTAETGAPATPSTHS